MSFFNDLVKNRIARLVFGVAGTPSADVITIQGIANGTGVNVTAIGNTDDAAWNGSDADATVISLLKKIALNTAA